MYEHDGSITRVISVYAEDVLTTSHSTTLINLTCEASEDGVCCQAVADRTYTIPSGITRRLCDEHFRSLLRLIARWHFTRMYTRPADEAAWLNREVG